MLKHHPNWQSKMTAVHDESTAFSAFYVDSKSSNLFGWLEWVIEDNLPFSFCERKNTKKYSKLDPISVKTFMKYLL